VIEGACPPSDRMWFAFEPIIDGSMISNAGKANDVSDTRAKSIQRLML
jgi:hypothetical protein